MAAPSLISTDGGTVLTSGSSSASLPGVVGNVYIFHIMQDGTGTAPSVTGTGDIASLAGVANSMTTLAASQPVGSPTAANQHLFIGRATGTNGFVNFSTPGDDLYCQLYKFANVNGGSTLADVIENGTAGVIANGAGTSTSVLDTGVTTLGPDRLALNCVGINDDATGIAAFVGMTGGTWAMPSSFESATGTDGTTALMTAAMASAGTINGGADTITSDGWGVVGFALIGTTVSAPVPRHSAINHQNPALV